MSKLLGANVVASQHYPAIVDRTGPAIEITSRGQRNIDRFASIINSVGTPNGFCYIFLVIIVLHKSRWLGYLFALTLSAGATAELIVPDPLYERARIPVFDTASNAVITLQHSSFADCARLTAILAQRTQALAAALDEREVTACKPNARGQLDFRFLTPNITRQTRLVWEFQVCDETDTCAPIGEVEYVVLPSDYLQPLIDWSREHAIFLVDPSGELAALLDRLKIEYYENPRELGANQQVVSFFHTTMANQTFKRTISPTSTIKRSIEFYNYPSAEPLILINNNSNNTVIEVRFPLTHDIRHDAANKKLLVELFQRLFM